MVPGGTNPMGASMAIEVTRGYTQSKSTTKTVSHMHSVSRAVENSLTTGYSGFGFSISDTTSVTVTSTSSVTHTLSHEISQSETFSDSFTQKCPPSTDESLKNNPGYSKGVAMWQWVVNSAYETLMSEAEDWSTFHTHHIVCTYGDEIKSYGPKPQCPITYCLAGTDNNCQKCSSYEWDSRYSSNKSDKDTTQSSNKGNGESVRSTDAASELPSDSSATSAGTGGNSSDHTTKWIIIGVVCAGVVVGVIAALYMVKHRTGQAKRMSDHIQGAGLEANLIENDVENDYRPIQGEADLTQRCVPTTNPATQQASSA
jgi:hypothetical protein